MAAKKEQLGVQTGQLDPSFGIETKEPVNGFDDPKRQIKQAGTTETTAAQTDCEEC